ncbi:hypothetical protein [Streptomyces sp. MP131-18]|uniref:hypothetical protein n=1 Tax=Streptomyces sp. MP131-18 TaxID=1857892 RepID=UPI00097BA9BE|nr:hypothetical protein [Streptomyces sp. MP131-18]ONK09457.1 hypothetical protein STBA_01570 [Streptomyces sp. MP131-18]
MAHYTAAEYRQLRRDAKAFARSAQPGRTYYVVEKAGGVKTALRVGEIQFTKKAFVGLMWGSYSPERFFVEFGPVYNDRGHPAIRSLPTWRESAEDEVKFEAAFLGSKGHHERVRQATAGTPFRSTW